MNDEQNAGKPSQSAEKTHTESIQNNKADDGYYSVDDPKKEVTTNIGDGEMHDEGLVGDGSVDNEGTFSEGTTNEQDEAENHDSEG